MSTEVWHTARSPYVLTIFILGDPPAVSMVVSSSLREVYTGIWAQVDCPVPTNVPYDSC